MAKPCLAIVLVNPQALGDCSSYLWCQKDEHDDDQEHQCFSGLRWSADKDDLVPPTANMVMWRVGTKEDVRRVSGRLVG